MKKEIWVCDRNERYAQKVTQALRERLSASERILVYTDAEHMPPPKAADCQMLVAGEGFEEIFLRSYEVTGRFIVRLGEVEKGRQGEEKPEGANNEGKIWMVDRFQPAVQMINELVNIFYGQMETELGKKCQYLGMTAAGAGGESSLYAMCTARYLAEHGKTLYLDLEFMQPLEKMTGISLIGTMSDFLFYFGQGSLQEKLSLCLTAYKDMDLIGPPSCPEDYQELWGLDYKSLRHVLEEEFLYRYVVINFGSSLLSCWELLENCGRIYLPESDAVLWRERQGRICRWMQERAENRRHSILQEYQLPEYWMNELTPFTVEELYQGGYRDAIADRMRRDGIVLRDGEETVWEEQT